VLSPARTPERQRWTSRAAGFSVITREHLLAAVLNGLAAASAARLPRLAEVGSPRPIVHVTGGAAVDVLHRDGRRRPAAAAGAAWTCRKRPGWQAFRCWRPGRRSTVA